MASREITNAEGISILRPRETPGMAFKRPLLLSLQSALMASPPAGIKLEMVNHIKKI